MTPILGIIASSFRSGAGPDGAYDALSTVTVPSGGAASVEFAGIPSGYKHLQIRIFAKTNRATYASDSTIMQFNGDTAANYSHHNISGDGTASLITQGYANTGGVYDGFEFTGTTNSSGWGAIIWDVLDYGSSSKNKTTKTLGGFDTNGTVAGYGGHVGMASGLWRSLNPITSIKFIPQYGSLFLQNSQFALYGVK